MFLKLSRISLLWGGYFILNYFIYQKGRPEIAKISNRHFQDSLL
ncbi:hypothetical protein CLOBOL_00912 [Enterocloster bolteae ATCC BAA-613]|uniref:Uncharacterized protein n=1 Tax=Enterocloster bolteae (strain ATCC BAA-613 / DSM 15670 / CCUG 46953 / JCM 12243 / WAL 16351) TaxID=411902 RepID=A8RJH1_ENTBW|nr:hypothetical protein CLOBOL_00912 [Enterocloster bolteae ATCC BAA-613]